MSPELCEIYEALTSIGRRRAALDAEGLRRALDVRIWQALGMVSPLDYLERTCGYAPKTAADRLRVAEALAHLPGVDGALSRGELSYTAAREIVRVVTPETESAWVDDCIGKTVRQVEQLVATHKRGDHPDDPGDPQIRPQHVTFELSPETYARLRQARASLADEHWRHLDDDAFIAALCEIALERTAVTETTGRARHQVALTVCERCDQAWQEGGGVQVPIDAVALDVARCNAQHLGSIHADAPARATQDVPPATVRLVKRRDGNRCRVPGCRSAIGLDVHHLVHRAHGGGHTAKNLVTLCSSCHRAIHAGTLVLHGTIDDFTVERPHEPQPLTPTWDNYPGA